MRILSIGFAVLATAIFVAPVLADDSEAAAGSGTEASAPADETPPVETPPTEGEEATEESE